MGLILQGILNAPYPDDPSEMDIVQWAQARSAMREAWKEIERLRNGLADARYLAAERRWPLVQSTLHRIHEESTQ